jgi:hypothetical protein
MKVTLVLQLAKALNGVVVGQPVDIAKSLGSAPASVTLEIVMGELPVFWNVADWFGLVKPIVWVGNCSTLCSSTAPVVAATPYPASAKVWVPALSVMLTAAVLAPSAPGLKLTLKLHSFPAVSVAVQLLPLIVK